jgi:hypothetical protein
MLRTSWEASTRLAHKGLFFRAGRNLAATSSIKVRSGFTSIDFESNGLLLMEKT